MTETTQSSKQLMSSYEDKIHEGVYGNYTITTADRVEVQRYRMAVMLCGVSFTAGISQWILTGPNWAGIWLLPMAVGLGLALNWIHIYLRPLHRALQIFWGLGCIGILILQILVGPENILTQLSRNHILTLAIGPFFAALTGLGFKEFFCFRRPEAIGLTLLIPIALLGHLSGLIKGEIVLSMLSFAAFLLLILAIRKFGTDPSADIGDKSVFEYLNTKEIANA